MTPYTSLLVSIPARPAAEGRTDQGSTLGTFSESGLSAATLRGPPFARAFESPLVAMSQDAEAFWADVGNPLLADHEIDRYIRADSPEARDLTVGGAAIRFQGRFVTVIEVDGELVAVVRGWLDPLNSLTYVLWTGLWIAAAILTFRAIVRIQRLSLRGRVDVGSEAGADVPLSGTPPSRLGDSPSSGTIPVRYGDRRGP